MPDWRELYQRETKALGAKNQLYRDKMNACRIGLKEFLNKYGHFNEMHELDKYIKELELDEEEPIFTLDEGWLYQFISWIHLERGLVLVDRMTADTPIFDEMIDAIKEFVRIKKAMT